MRKKKAIIFAAGEPPDRGDEEGGAKMKRSCMYLVLGLALVLPGIGLAQSHKVLPADPASLADKNVLMRQLGDRLWQVTQKIHKAYVAKNLTKAQMRTKINQLKAIRTEGRNYMVQNGNKDLTTAQAALLNQALDVIGNSVTP
jgi:hypothetical protein